MTGSLFGNIAGTLYFLYFQIAGILLFSYILKKEGALTRLLLGSSAGSLLLHWLPVLFSFFFDFTIVSHLLAALSLLPVYILFPGNREMLAASYRELPSRIRFHRFFLFALTGTFLLWIYLLYTHTILPGQNGGLYTGQCTYGDMNMHLGFITGIANQSSFPPEYSLFPGTRLSYPFLSDSISSSIYLMGASLRYAYILPMLTAFLQVVGSVYLLAVSLFQSRAKAVLTYVLYFFNGGLGFLYFIDWTKEGGYSLSDIFTGFYTTPTNLVDHNIRWVNMIADMLLPQRATLFGYALLFPCIWLLHQAVFRDKKEYFLPAGIFAGALPMIHTHSFLGIGLISASWLLIVLYRGSSFSKKIRWMGAPLLTVFVLFMCLVQYGSKKDLLSSQDFLLLGILGIVCCILYGLILLFLYLKKHDRKLLLKTWGIYLLCALLLALPQLLFWTFGQVATGGFLRGHFNWGNQGDFYPWFYLKNLGVPLLCILMSVCAGRRKSAHLILPAFVIWYVAELIMFTPNTYDNNKLLYIAYLLLCLSAADYAAELYKRIQDMGGAKLLAGTFLFFSVFSAVLTLGREAVSKYQLYSPSHTALAEYIEANTKTDEVFLTSTRHNNEVSSLAGRNIVCGADTFLYFHGIDTSLRKSHLKLMYEAPLEHLDLYEQYNVSYVVISSWERADYAIDEDSFADLFELVFSLDEVSLYRCQ